MLALTSRAALVRQKSLLAQVVEEWLLQVDRHWKVRITDFNLSKVGQCKWRGRVIPFSRALMLQGGLFGSARFSLHDGPAPMHFARLEPKCVLGTSTGKCMLPYAPCMHDA